MTSRIADKLRGSATFWLFPLALITLLTVLHLLHDSSFERAAYDRAEIAAGALWRLLSGHLVHWNAAHLLMNLAAIVVWLLLCPRSWSAMQWGLRLAVLALVIGIGMWCFFPETQRYAGFSGVMHGLFVLGLAPLARAGDRVALACLLILVGKVGLEQWQGAPIGADIDIGVRVATEAHLLGALGALGILIAQFFVSLLRTVDDKTGDAAERAPPTDKREKQ